MSYFSLILLTLPFLSLAQYKAGFYPLNLSMINPNMKTNDFSTELNYCSCDITANACDYACCCDTDCPYVKIKFTLQNKFIHYKQRVSLKLGMIKISLNASILVKFLFWYLFEVHISEFKFELH